MSRTQVHQNLQRHIVIVGLLVIAAGFVAASDTLHDKADQLIVWCEGVIALEPVLGMAAFVLLAMVSAMVAFFSTAIIVPIAVFAWGKTTCMILLWCGWLMGGIASFCIGRFLGRKVAAVLIGEDKIAGWQTQVSDRARFRHVLLFQAVVPSEIPGYVLGLLRYRFSFYLAALAITELPYVFAVVYLGESFLKGESTLIILLGAAIVLLGILWFRIRGTP